MTFLSNVVKMIKILVFLLALSAQATTLLRIQCGGPGGADPLGNAWQSDSGYYTGGAAWSTANQVSMGTLPVPYSTLRYSASPPGSAVTYAVPVPAAATAYKVTLKFVEPNKTAAGQRVFQITANGAVVAPALDIFSAASGALMPYDLPAFTAISSAGSQIVVTLAPQNASMNVVISGIQVDDAIVILPPSPPLTRTAKATCEIPYGEGGAQGGDISSGLYQLWGCWNLTGMPDRITSVRCASGAPGTILDVLVPDVTASDPKTLKSILPSPITCSVPPDPVVGTALTGISYPPGEFLRFNITVAAPVSGASTASQIVAVVDYEWDVQPPVGFAPYLTGLEAAAPVCPATGLTFFYATDTDHLFRCYNGGEWKVVGDVSNTPPVN